MTEFKIKEWKPRREFITVKRTILASMLRS
jgi:hypothetical protein